MIKKKGSKSTKEKSSKKKADNIIDITPMLGRGAFKSGLPKLYGERGGNALDEAQDIMYRAWETKSRSRRIALARKALTVSLDCADAYVLLAEEAATSLDEAMELNQKGVEAGERAIGKRAFKEDVGHFWGILETRPYMRARVGLAQCLWDAGKKKEAVEHYKDMLRLNPGDNQGIRYVLISCLLDLGRDRELTFLLEEYQSEDDTYWLYTKTLLSFRDQGDSEEARGNLEEARDANPHVPLYLLGKKKIPKRLPDYIGFGDESEALSYAADNIENWKATPGALDWMASQSQ
jgi:tetratricopeptide (TPR) repeat protein